MAKQAAARQGHQRLVKKGDGYAGRRGTGRWGLGGGLWWGGVGWGGRGEKRSTLTIVPSTSSPRPHQGHTPGIALQHLPPNSARTGNATEGVLFTATHLSTDAVSALRKVWVPVRLWEQQQQQQQKDCGSTASRHAQGAAHMYFPERTDTILN